jgi:FkbM family methyltransferase
MYSQLGQDAWVLSRKTTPGYFVELGAFDGVHLSNTLLLERKGWRGLCIEPEPMAYIALLANRNCQCANVAVYKSESQSLPFVSNGIYSAIAIEPTNQTIDVAATTLDWLLEAYGAPKSIDYISIDTEGNELEILQSFDFAKWQVALWTIEHNDHLHRTRAKSRAIIRLMASHGFLHRIVEHDVWFHREGSMRQRSLPVSST